MNRVRWWKSGWWALLLAGLALGLTGAAWQITQAAPAGEVVYDRPLTANSSGGANGGANGGTVGDAPAPGAPRARLPENVFDFGRVAGQGQVQHDFYLRNEGSVDLLIERAYTTCGCTTAEISASVIPPGKAARITVTFDAGYHPLRGVTVRRGLILESNDPQQPQIELWVQASID